MHFIKMRIKGMFEPTVMISCAFVMMVITLLLTYRVLSGNVPDVALASKAIRLLILDNLILDAGVAVRLCIPVVREIHDNGFISLFKITDEDLDDDMEDIC